METNDIAVKWNAALWLANIKIGRKTVGGSKTDFLCYVININVKKENTNLKFVTVINHVTGWF